MISFFLTTLLARNMQHPMPPTVVPQDADNCVDFDMTLFEVGDGEKDGQATKAHLEVILYERLNFSYIHLFWQAFCNKVFVLGHLAALCFTPNSNPTVANLRSMHDGGEKDAPPYA